MAENSNQTLVVLKRLNEQAMRPGDIVLTTTTAAVSTAIRIATKSDISHAMVYVEDRSVIDATGEGVHARNTQRLFFEPECSVHVLRLRDGVSDEQLRLVLAYMRGAVGTEYSTKEAIRTVLGGAREWSKKQYCSRLVAQAFAHAGIQLVPDPNYCSPAGLRDSPLLVAVAGATVPVAPKEAVWFEQSLDVTQAMRDATNKVLAGARAVDKNLQTFDDLHRRLAAHPEDDDRLCRVLEDSGYLSVWRIERARNPWQYDLELMGGLPPDKIEEYCWSVLANDGIAGPNRYILNRGGYELFSRQYDLRFFRMMRDLYDALVELHARRIETAAKWLQLKGHLPPSSKPHLTPHASSWFAALEQWNPPQATMTRAIVECAGSTEVCSICGDDSAGDYRLPGAQRPAGGVDTLRLCDECLEIRRHGGELFVPVSEFRD